MSGELHLDDAYNAALIVMEKDDSVSDLGALVRAAVAADLRRMAEVVDPLVDRAAEELGRTEGGSMAYWESSQRVYALAYHRAQLWQRADELDEVRS